MSASLVAQRRSYSLLSRRGWPCQANVLAPPHRRGSTGNPGGGSYLDQSIWSGGRSLGTPRFLSRGGGETICALAPRVGSLPSLPFPVPLEAASHPTCRRRGNGGRPPARSTSCTPARSLLCAGCPTARTTHPSVSTSRWRWRPVTGWPPSSPRSPPTPVVCTDCLSMLPARGGGSRPKRPRSRPRTALWRPSHPPSSRPFLHAGSTSFHVGP